MTEETGRDRRDGKITEDNRGKTLNINTKPETQTYDTCANMLTSLIIISVFYCLFFQMSELNGICLPALTALIQNSSMSFQKRVDVLEFVSEKT